MKIPSVVLAEVDYEAAVVGELSARNRFLPPSLSSLALIDYVKQLAARLETRMRSGFEPQPHDNVLARKSGRGSRPLPYIALEDRFVYRALVDVIEKRLPQGLGRGDYEAFLQSPLKVEGCEYVLKADVAAYYQYVDHERLIDEVVAQTGDDLAVTAVVELLEAGSGRRFGLPQMHTASAVLADAYIDPIRRSLIRSGRRAFRYADDFRVPCADYSEALSALELIERSAYDLGLVLNEGKTSTPRRARYEQSLADVQVAENELFDAVGVDHGGVAAFFAAIDSAYGGDDADAEDDTILRFLPGEAHDETDPLEDLDDDLKPSSDQIAVAARVIEIWQGPEPFFAGWSGSVWSALLRKALATLESAEDPVGVDATIGLLVTESALTPQVCTYLIAVGRQEPRIVHRVLDELCRKDIVSVWQSLWIAYLAGSVPGGTSNQVHVAWLRRQVESPHQAVAAEAALALARRRLLTVDMGARAYGQAAPAHRATAALALAAAHGAARTEFVPNDQLENWLATYVAAQPWGRPRVGKRAAKRG